MSQILNCFTVLCLSATGYFILDILLGFRLTRWTFCRVFGHHWETWPSMKWRICTWCTHDEDYV